MTFEEEFPSLSRVHSKYRSKFPSLLFFDFYADSYGNSEFNAGEIERDIREHCLDKQRVKEAIKNLESEEGRGFPTIYRELGLEE